MNILSIQSHVAYGHVGNAAATFPLQRLGFEVWPVHTVLFSNHAGYASFKGRVLAVDDVRGVIAGIEDLGLFRQCDAVLSGYLGDSPLGEVVLETVEKVRAANPNMLYCCDPVMGDVGSDIYVRETIPPFLRKKAVKAADIITPNLFELSLLTGRDLTDMDDVIAATRGLIANGPKLALVTSVNRPGLTNGNIEMIAVSASEAYLISTPKISFGITPNGAGDVASALFLAYCLKGMRLNEVLENVARVLFAMFTESKRRDTRELQVIAAQDCLVSTDKPFKAVMI